MAEILTGEIGLHRERQDFSAGFCVMKASLGSLVERIGFLHPTETAYYQTLKHDLRRASYLAGRIAAKMAIGALAAGAGSGVGERFQADGSSGAGAGLAGSVGSERRIDPASIAIDFGVFQFPVVKHYPEGAVQVSISHCDDLGVALAFPEEHPLGVDLERADGVNTEAIRPYVSPVESALLARHGLEESPGLTFLWTMKEGVSKVLRTGLMADLRLLEIDSVEIDADGSTYVATFRHLGGFKAMTRCAGPYVCSVILPGKTTPDLAVFWQRFEEVAKG